MGVARLGHSESKKNSSQRTMKLLIKIFWQTRLNIVVTDGLVPESI